MFLSCFGVNVRLISLKSYHRLFLYATFIYVRAGFVLVLLGHALHRQGDALLGGVHIQHLDPHNVADLGHLARVLDKFIADL